MTTYLVAVKYNPGLSKSYIVEGVNSHDQARARVVKIIGYDPGVPVEVTEVPIDKNKPVRYQNLGAHND
jgi:hypothetical protein